MNESKLVRGGLWHRLRGQANVLVRGKRGTEAVVCGSRAEACSVLRAIGPAFISATTTRDDVLLILAAVQRCAGIVVTPHDRAVRS